MNKKTPLYAKIIIFFYLSLFIIMILSSFVKAESLIFFDEFNDASIDTDKWTESDAQGLMSETGGYFRIYRSNSETGTGLSKLSSKIEGIIDDTHGIRIESSVYVADQLGSTGGFQVGLAVIDNLVSCDGYGNYRGIKYNFQSLSAAAVSPSYIELDSSCNYHNDVTLTLPFGSWYDVEILYYPNNKSYTYTDDYGNKLYQTASETNTLTNISFFGDFSAPQPVTLNYDIRYDYIRYYDLDVTEVSDFKLNLTKYFGGDLINSYTLSLTNSTGTFEFNTKNGTIYTPSYNELVNISIWNITGNTFYNVTNLNYNVSTDLTETTYQSKLIMDAYDGLSLEDIANFNFTISTAGSSQFNTSNSTNKTTFLTNAEAYNYSGRAHGFGTINQSGTITLSALTTTEILINFTLGGVNTYGPFNSSSPFNQIHFNSDCVSAADIQVSRSTSSFQDLTSDYHYQFNDVAHGFYASINSSRCSWIEITTLLDQKPIVSQTSPADLANISSTSQTFQCFGNDEYNLSSMRLYINGTLNSTNSNPTNNANTAFTLNGLPRPYELTWACEACDGNTVAFQCNSTTNRTLYIYDPGLRDITLTINNTDADFDIELGTLVYVNATIDTGETVCLDIIHPKYGLDYICGVNKTSLVLNITNFLTNATSEGNETFNLTFTNAPENKTFNISAHQYDEVDELKFSVLGYAVGDDFPSGVKMYVGDTLDTEISSLQATGFNLLDAFNDSTTSKAHTFTESETYTIGYVEIPQTATIVSSTIDITGASAGLVSDVTCTLDAMTSRDPTAGCGRTVEFVEYSTPEKAIYVYGFTEDETCVPFYSDITKANFSFYHSSLISSAFGTVKVVLSNDGSGITCDSCMSATDAFTNCNIDATETYQQDVNLISGTVGNRFYFDAFTVVNKSFSTNKFLSFYIRPVGGSTVHASLGGTSSPSVLVMSYNKKTYNPALYVNTNKTWAYTSGLYTTTETTTNMTAAIQTYLDDLCVADGDGNCQVPIKVFSNSAGTITLDEILINYTTGGAGEQRVSLDADTVEATLLSLTNYTNLTITVQSATNGTIQVENISYLYAGGNATFNISAHETGSYNFVNSSILTYYHSRWNYTFPNNIEYWEYIPRRPDSKNVTPYGQSDKYPIFNISFFGYSAKTMNFSIWLNESISCVNLSFLNHSNRADNSGILDNKTWSLMADNKVYLDNIGLWSWADYECDFSSWYLFQPDVSFRACCDGCVCSEENT